MKIGGGSTSRTLKCTACKKVTSQFKLITHSGLELEIPACDACYDDINTDKSIVKLLSEIKAILLKPILVKNEKHEKQLKNGDLVCVKRTLHVGKLIDIQYVHDRYQLHNISGWQYGIDGISKEMD